MSTVLQASWGVVVSAFVRISEGAFHGFWGWREGLVCSVNSADIVWHITSSLWLCIFLDQKVKFLHLHRSTAQGTSMVQACQLPVAKSKRGSDVVGIISGLLQLESGVKLRHPTGAKAGHCYCSASAPLLTGELGVLALCNARIQVVFVTVRKQRQNCSFRYAT